MNGVHSTYVVNPDGRGVIVKKRDQEPDKLNAQQREIDHMMRCTKTGCVRCT